MSRQSHITYDGCTGAAYFAQDRTFAQGSLLLGFSGLSLESLSLLPLILLAVDARPRRLWLVSANSQHTVLGPVRDSSGDDTRARPLAGARAGGRSVLGQPGLYTAHRQNQINRGAGAA